MPLTLAVLLIPILGISQTNECDSFRHLRVLFIGNSFTYVHNVPKLLEGIAKQQRGPCIETLMIAEGGATLEAHWKTDSVAKVIRQGKWTHIILNDQSSFGEGWWLEGVERVGTSGRELQEFGGKFVDLIRATGATPVIIAHWADAAAPARDQQALDAVFSKFATATGTSVVPVGTAIKRMQRELPHLSPYLNDQHHLSPVGAYLQALAVYTVTTGISSRGAPNRVFGPAVEFNRGIVFSDSIVPLVDLSASDAAAIQGIVAGAKWRSVDAPSPLSAEFPTVPEGEVIQPSAVKRTWQGKSRVLPNPANDSVTIALRNDSLFLTTGPLRFAGPATYSIDTNGIKIAGSVTSPPMRGRGYSPPLSVVLHGTMRGGIIRGVAKIEQRFQGSMGSFDAIGQFELR